MSFHSRLKLLACLAGCCAVLAGCPPPTRTPTPSVVPQQAVTSIKPIGTELRYFCERVPLGNTVTLSAAVPAAWYVVFPDDTVAANRRLIPEGVGDRERFDCALTELELRRWTGMDSPTLLSRLPLKIEVKAVIQDGNTPSTPITGSYTIEVISSCALPFDIFDAQNNLITESCILTLQTTDVNCGREITFVESVTGTGTIQALPVWPFKVKQVIGPHRINYKGPDRKFVISDTVLSDVGGTESAADSQLRLEVEQKSRLRITLIDPTRTDTPLAIEGGEPLQTPTHLPPTATPTPSSSATISPTPSLALTPSPSATATPTISWTPTPVTATPTPSTSWTPTSTVTPTWTWIPAAPNSTPTPYQIVITIKGLPDDRLDCCTFVFQLADGRSQRLALAVQPRPNDYESGDDLTIVYTGTPAIQLRLDGSSDGSCPWDGYALDGGDPNAIPIDDDKPIELVFTQADDDVRSSTRDPWHDPDYGP